MTRIAVADIGGTHARFALASIGDGGGIELGPTSTFRIADHASIESAWGAFAAASEVLPRAAAFAVAAPITEEPIRLTNAPWVITPALLAGQLGLDRVELINDFGAVAHAVAQLGPEGFGHLCGPDTALPAAGTIAIVGPGTGLGVACLRRGSRGYAVTETEGGHIGFAPADAFEDALLVRLRARYGRVSAERIVSGPGLPAIAIALAEVEGTAAPIMDERALWTAALDGSDRLAEAALDRFCAMLGSMAGDIALAQGADGVVIAGGLGRRLADRLPRSEFRMRFVDKGRFARQMAALPVKLVLQDQPGLLGAAAAFARRIA